MAKESNYRMICKGIRITKLAVPGMSEGKGRGAWRGEDGDRERASPSSTGPDGGPPTSMCTTASGKAVGRAGFNDQDAITLNGKKL